MRGIVVSVVVAVMVGGGAPVLALNPGSDILVPAAARGAGLAGSTWATDLYLFNPGTEPVSATLYWLERGQANPSPSGVGFTLLPGETLVLDDVVLEVFGLDSGNGAFRVVADGDVVVNSRIYNLKGAVTFGQGFAGVPREAAVMAGEVTDVVGLAHNGSFRTNLVLMDASGSGATVALSVRTPAGDEIASGSFALGAFEPRLFSIAALDASLAFDAATLHAEVTQGAAIVVASKVDNDPATGDPTTLDAWRQLGAGASDSWPAPVARTGQTLCYDTGGAVVACAGTGQDGDVQAGVAWPTPRFVDNGDGTVTDMLTGLVWLRNANCFGSRTDWGLALDDANTLASGACGLTDGSVAGDWRLPSISELQSLADDGYYSPALSNAAGTGQWVEGNAFTGVQSYRYWSSTSYAYNPEYAWDVSLQSFHERPARKTDGSSASHYVWPVRGGR